MGVIEEREKKERKMNHKPTYTFYMTQICQLLLFLFFEMSKHVMILKAIVEMN